MQAIEWVLFDLGGVLVNVEQSRIFDSLGAKLKLTPSDIKEALVQYFPLSSDFVVREYTPQEVADEINRILGLALGVSERLSVEEVVEAFNAELGSAILSTSQILPDLRQRVAIGCLSNTNSIHWDRLLGAYDFMGHFDRRFASQIIGHAKPDTAIYLRVAELIGVKPKQILFFDDRIENVEAATRLGWNARLYINHSSLVGDLRELSLL